MILSWFWCRASWIALQNPLVPEQTLSNQRSVKRSLISIEKPKIFFFWMAMDNAAPRAAQNWYFLTFFSIKVINSLDTRKSQEHDHYAKLCFSLIPCAIVLINCCHFINFVYGGIISEWLYNQNLVTLMVTEGPGLGQVHNNKIRCCAVYRSTKYT